MYDFPARGGIDTDMEMAFPFSYSSITSWKANATSFKNRRLTAKNS